MGKLQQAQDVEAGKALLEEARGYGSNASSTCDGIVQLARNYAGFRARLEADDVADADAYLQYSIAQNKPKLDSLTPDEKVWVDAFMAGLGYSPTV